MIPTQAQEEEQTKLDLSNFFDPWDLYRGDIPLKEEFKPSNDSRIPGRVEVTQELRDYVWQYKDQQQNSSTSNVHDTEELPSLGSPGRSHEHHDHHSHRQLSLAPHESHPSHHLHLFDHDSNFSHKQAHDSHVGDPSQSYHYHQHNDCQHAKEDYSLTEDKRILNTQVKSQNDHSMHRSKIHAPHLHGDHHNIKQVHHVRLDVQNQSLKKSAKKKTKPLHRIDICDGTGVMNGDISSEDEEMEVVQPKHPYDGFYLRHRATIDPNGRKICTNQLPPTPPPSPPPESPESNDHEEVEQDLIDQQVSASSTQFLKSGYVQNGLRYFCC